MVEEPDAFDAAACDLALRLADEQAPTAGVVARHHDARPGVDATVRRVHQRPLPRSAEAAPLYEHVAALAARGNLAFGFELDGVEEDLVVVDYGPGDFYNWHLDTGPAAPMRKLSISVLLSSPDDYDGGALTFPGRVVRHVPRGGAVVFPSFLLHGVQPVTAGLRRVLLAWVSGPRFR